MSGKIYIAGMGPGSPKAMTRECMQCLEEADVIVGYTVYTDLLKPFFPDKEFAQTGMRQEIERCRMCFDLAKEGKNCVLVCSGDAGVYGMAAPMYELLPEYLERPGYEGIELIIIPGVTAALSGAAVLGAPLNHDFCIISLSDLLTPWEIIEKRLRAAISGDFAIAIYNPSSRKRKDYLHRACEIMLDAGADSRRACGYVRNIDREGMESGVMTLGELKDFEADMFTTVFVGNSGTKIYENKLVTARGYEI